MADGVKLYSMMKKIENTIKTDPKLSVVYEMAITGNETEDLIVTCFNLIQKLIKTNLN